MAFVVARQANRGRPLASHLVMAGIAMVFVGEPEEVCAWFGGGQSWNDGHERGRQGHQTISMLPLDVLLLPGTTLESRHVNLASGAGRGQGCIESVPFASSIDLVVEQGQGDSLGETQGSSARSRILWRGSFYRCESP